MTADLGPEVALRLTADLRREAERLSMRHSRRRRRAPHHDSQSHRVAAPGAGGAGGPAVYLVVGVNGTGKTTTAAKLAARFLG